MSDPNEASRRAAEEIQQQALEASGIDPVALEEALQAYTIEGGVPAEPGLEDPWAVPGQSHAIPGLAEEMPPMTTGLSDMVYSPEELQRVGYEGGVPETPQGVVTQEEPPAASPMGNIGVAELNRREQQRMQEENEGRGVGSTLTQYNLRAAAGIVEDAETGVTGTVDPGFIPPRRAARNANQFVLQSVFERMGPVAPELQAYMNDLDAAAQQARAAALQAYTDGLDEDGDVLSDLAEKRMEEAIEFKASAQEAHEQNMAQVQRLQSIVDAIAQRQIDPNRLFNNQGSGARFGAAMAIAAGAIAQAYNPGTQNLPLTIINQAIDRDIQAQMADSQNLVAAAGAQQSLIGAMRAAYGDDRVAFEALRAMRTQQAAADLAARAKRHKGTQAAAAFIAGEIALKQQAAEAMAAVQRENGKVRLTETMRLNRGQARSIEHALATPGTMAPAPQRTGGGRRRPTTAPTAGGGDSIESAVRQAATRGSALTGIPIDDTTSQRALADALPPELMVLRDRTRGTVSIVHRGAFNTRPQSDVQAELELSGVHLPGLGITLNQDQAQALSRQFPSAEAYSRFMDGLNKVMTVERIVDRLNTMAEEEGGWNRFGESRYAAEAMTETLKPMVGTALGLGALAAADLDIVDASAVNPTDVFTVHGAARLEAMLTALKDAAYQPLRSIGIDPERNRNTLGSN